MRKISLVGVLLVVGCTYQTIDEDGECDEMGCNIPHEQHTMQWVNGSSLLIANNNGTACISLGSQDTAGVVLVTPLKNQGTAIKPIVVSANSPYVGWLEGPLQVTPVAGEIVTATDSPQIDLLDIIAWSEIPPFNPVRAAYYFSGVPTVATGTNQYFRVRGRKRISCIVQASTGQTVTVAGYRVANNGVLEQVDVQTGTTIVINEFSYNYNWATATADKGYTLFDYIAIQKGGGTWVAADIQAWDY